MDLPRAQASGAPLVVATDLDRTFTQVDLHLDPEALEVAQLLRGHGVHLVLATGRSLAELPEPDVLTATFDGFVLEGGAVWGRPGHWKRVHDFGALRAFASELRRRNVDVEEGTASISVPRAAEAIVATMRGHEHFAMHANVDRLDVVPKGADKGTGLRALLAAAPRTGASILSIGDGENDLPLFAASHYRVAVANAAPALMAQADEVAPLPASQGFCWLARRMLAQVPGGMSAGPPGPLDAGGGPARQGPASSSSTLRSPSGGPSRI